jgi:uncharacterized protein YgiM (DUF1202 family)
MRKLYLFYLLIALLLPACVTVQSEPTPQIIVPTALVTAEPAVPAQATETLPPPPTFAPNSGATHEPTNQPASQPTSQPAQPTATSEPQPSGAAQYQVAFVTADDTLNVRSGPGVANGVVGELAPNAASVRMTGPGQMVDGSTWVPIAAGALTGWVNSRFLAQTVTETMFCTDPAVTKLVADLETAVLAQDGTLLAQLIHPERGLRIHYTWWNPAVSISQADARNIFTSAAGYDWGYQDGSGLPITGTFKDNILPLLQEDLVLATQFGCDEIIHGGTAGFVRLPDGYDAIHIYSLHRPGTDEFAGMNWGTWAVGIEQWQGAYYVSFLIHFQWEI